MKFINLSLLGLGVLLTGCYRQKAAELQKNIVNFDLGKEACGQ